MKDEEVPAEAHASRGANRLPQRSNRAAIENVLLVLRLRNTFIGMRTARCIHVVRAEFEELQPKRKKLGIDNSLDVH